MSSASTSNDKISTSAAASIPQVLQPPQDAPSRPTSTEHNHPQSSGRLAAASRTTPPDDNILSPTPDNATTPRTAPDEPPSGTGNALIHDPHEEMQTHQGSPLEIIVTDVDAESMICCNGSVDGSIHDRILSDSTRSSTEDKLCSYIFFVIPRSQQSIWTFAENLFDPGVSNSRPSRVQQDLDRIDRYFSA